MKVSTRFTLPGEIVIACASISWGVGGVFSSGPIHRLATANDSWLTWVFLMVGVGGLMLTSALLELVHGMEWDDEMRLQSVRIRAACQFISMGMWLYVFKLLFDSDLALRAVALTCQAPAFGILSAWFYFETMRARYALDPTKYTPGLVLRR